MRRHFHDEPLERRIGTVGGERVRLRPCGHRSRIVEGAQQPGDVVQRRGFGAAYLQLLRRLSLEIDDIHIAGGDQHLAEMEIAMDARLQRSFPGRGEGRDEVEQRLPIIQNEGGILRDFWSGERS